jgi:FixJ family two-component response regulator
MARRVHKRVYVFEKEPRQRAVLEASLTPEEALVAGFSEGRRCLHQLATKPCDLLIIALEGCEPEGLELLEQARRTAPWIPSLIIVEHAAVSSAVRAVRAGAVDCLDLPVERDQLLSTVRTHLARVDPSARRRPRALTVMEVQILQMILAGRTSHEIANTLQRSKRTIDVHRKNIMRKLQATDLVDLIKRALSMGFAETPDPRPTSPSEIADPEPADEPPAQPPDHPPTGG